MQYQTKWVRNMLKLFSSRPSSLIRTCLLTGLVLGSLGVAIASLQLFQVNARSTFKHVGQAPDMSIRILSHIDQLTVTYRLTVRNEAHAGTIRKGIPIRFTDTIPLGLSNVRAKGDHWDTKVNPNVRPSSVTGTYKGSYPVTPGATLSTVIITGTITRDASNVLTNSASVNVPGNADNAHCKAVVHDNIGPVLSSLSSLNKDNSNSSCDSSCNDQTSNVCDKECSQQSVHTSFQEKIHISIQESVDTSCECDQENTSSNAKKSDTTSHGKSNSVQESVDTRPYSGSERASLETNTQTEASPLTTTPTGIESTSCECDQENTSSNAKKSDTTSHGKSDTTPGKSDTTPGKRSTDPFPGLPNTGSDPNYKG